MKRAVHAATGGAVTRIPQVLNAGETLRVIPGELLETGKQRLKDGTYSHFASHGLADRQWRAFANSNT